MGPIATAAIPGIIGGAGTLLGSLMGMQGQTDANQANARQAQLQRDFQERMSNTEVQRRVNDLRAAGLNPALAYGQGGASAPSGAMATMQNTKAGLQQGATSAAQTAANLAQTVAGTQKLQAEAKSAITEAELNKNALGYRQAMIYNQSIREGALTQFMQDPQWLVQQFRQQKADAEQTESSARGARARATLDELMENEARAGANSWGSGWGQNIRPYMNDAKGIIGIAGSLRGGQAFDQTRGVLSRGIENIQRARANAKLNKLFPPE